MSHLKMTVGAFHNEILKTESAADLYDHITVGEGWKANAVLICRNTFGNVGGSDVCRAHLNYL